MMTEDENWRKHFSDDNEGGDRDGYQPYNNGNKPVTPGRRPRISRPAYSTGMGNEGRSGQSREGYGSQRESTYSHREGGYQSRGYRGYQNREGYANQREGAYPRREGGYQSRDNRTYQSRSNFGTQNEGGYRRREGSYQYRSDGYQSREGGYQRREGGFHARREGTFSQDGRGAYRQQRRPYRPRTSDYDPSAKYSLKKRIEYKETHYDPNEPVRLNKFLANAGVCSRREADDFIQAGVVSVNGTTITELGAKVLRSDDVRFHDQPVTMEKKVYVLLNKPKDCVTTSDDPQNRKTVMDLVKDACRERIYPVGRLDRNTTGVLLLTNDGELASKLTHPQYRKKKIYHVFLDKNVTAADLRQISEGIQLEDGEIHADAIEYASETDKKQVGIEIHSGKNRIVRRIFEHLGYHVVKLDRVYFAGLTKKNVRRGDWRYLTEKEVAMLRMGAFE